MKRVYSRISRIVGNVITVRAKGVQYEELAEVTTSFGKSLAQVIQLKDEDVTIVVFKPEELPSHILI